MAGSFVRKFAFDQLPLHGAFVELTDVWHKISTQKEYPEGIKQVVGELLAANILLTTNIKLDGKIIAQIQGNPKLDLIVSECNNDLKVRATAKFATSIHQDNQVSYMDCMHEGSLVITIDSNSAGKMYQSVVALTGHALDEVLTEYMLQSEQLRTVFFIAYSKKKIVGFMLQKLPDPEEIYNDDIERIFYLAQTIKYHELLITENSALLKQLFSEDDIILFDAKPVQFSCSCGHNRVVNIIRSLGLEEAQSIIADEGMIKVTCDFCNSVYVFTEADILHMFNNLALDLECISSEPN
ncbi:MAG: Hsp33 family molecular chaperone HslO [Burkholderiales bacterium]|nr:Hsp33 family molecular chaperone HslO [Burkholderiales bacterium]